MSTMVIGRERAHHCATRVLVVAATVLGLASAPTARATVEAPVDAGDVIVMTVTTPPVPADRGVSASLFGLALPEGAACPGDSEHDQWRVQTFIVPDGVDPATIVYGANGPEGQDQYALYLTDTQPFVDMLTRPNLEAGQPGVIAPIAPLSFAVFPPQTLPSGMYRIGVACTYFERKTAKFWDARFEVTDTPSDQPGQMVWRLPDQSSGGTAQAVGASAWPRLGAIVLALLAVASLGWFLSLRRKSAHSTLSKEST